MSEETTARRLGQFYTKEHVAKKLIDICNERFGFDNYNVILEPSAGDGSFYSQIRHAHKIGLDIDPKHPEVRKEDFKTWEPAIPCRILTIGNPPFGKNATEAVEFFNHAAKFSEVIAFILPRTFRKPSIINRLDSSFNLYLDYTIPPDSFRFLSKSYDVACCAQIWVKQQEPREKVKIYTKKDVKHAFEFVDPSEADFAIRRVGSGAGTVFRLGLEDLNLNTTYFIKSLQPGIVDDFEAIDFSGVKNNTAGIPSISINELVFLWLSKPTTLDD